MVTDLSIKTEKIAIVENTTDMLIKSVSILKAKHCVDMFGIHSA